MIEREYTRNEELTINGTSLTIAEARERQVIYIKNTSAAAQVITLVYGDKVAVAGAGIVLAAGEFTIDSSDSGYTCFQGQIQAISSAAGGTIAIMER